MYKRRAAACQLFNLSVFAGVQAGEITHFSDQCHQMLIPEKKKKKKNAKFDVPHF